MISFDILKKENFDELKYKLSALLGDDEMTAGILESFLEIATEGVEVAVSAAHGELLVRIYDDGRYSFVFPIEISEDTDTDAALLELAAYTVKELIPFYLTDTPREELDRLRCLFSHIDARAYDEDEDSFVALVYSECDMLDDVPTVSKGGITLSRITERDMAAYAAVCRSDEVNKYWGYDYKDDEQNADAGYFLRVAESEFARGIALSLAIREGTADAPMLGEAVVFDFDFRGGAKVALRLLPEFWARGIGSRTLEALIELAGKIGLSQLYAEVRLENLRSLRMMEKYMERKEDVGDRAQFSLSLA